MTDLQAVLSVAAAVLVTALTRFLPFWVFGEKRKTPEIITYLGKALPCAIIGMLVVYCLKDVSILDSPHGIPELIAGALVVILHLWKRNTLLSIAGGTVCYMILIQVVFV